METSEVLHDPGGGGEPAAPVPTEPQPIGDEIPSAAPDAGGVSQEPDRPVEVTEEVQNQAVLAEHPGLEQELKAVAITPDTGEERDKSPGPSGDAEQLVLAAQKQEEAKIEGTKVEETKSDAGPVDESVKEKAEDVPTSTGNEGTNVGDLGGGNEKTAFINVPSTEIVITAPAPESKAESSDPPSGAVQELEKVEVTAATSAEEKEKGVEAKVEPATEGDAEPTAAPTPPGTVQDAERRPKYTRPKWMVPVWRPIPRIRSLANPDDTPPAQVAPTGVVPAVPEVQPAQHDGTSKNDKTSNKAQDSTGAGGTSAREEAKAKPDELVPLFVPDTVLPGVDIIAVHDIEESLDNAWMYILDRDSLKDSENQVDDILGDGAEELGRSGSKRRRSLLKNTLKVLDKEAKEREAKKGGHSKDVKNWQSTVDPEAPAEDISAPVPAESSGDTAPIPHAQKEEAAETEADPDDGGPLGGPSMAPAVGLTGDMEGKGKGKETGEPVDSDQKVPPEVDPGVKAGDPADGRPAKGDAGSHHSEPGDPQAQSSDGKAPEDAPTKGNWLTDPTMLSGHVSMARIMAFSYAAPKKVQEKANASASSEYTKYLDKTIDTFIAELTKHRPSEYYSKVPLVLIGTGFGCLGIEKLLGTLAKRAKKDKLSPASSILNMLAGVIFFDAPNPIPRETEQKKEPEQKRAAEPKDKKDTDPKKENEKKKDADKKEEKKEEKKNEKREDDTKKEPEKKKESEKKKEPESKKETAPEEESKGFRGIFPPASNANSRWVNSLLEPRLIDSGKIWEEFHPVVETNDIPVIWFYKPIRDKRVEASVPGVKFVPFEVHTTARKAVQGKTPVRSGRFRGQKDRNFRRLVEELRGCLLLKASVVKDLEKLLREFITSEFDLKVVDHKNRCPLHRAASKSNVGAVMQIVTANPGLVTVQDSDRRIPLHYIVLEAVKSGADEESTQAPFKHMIEKVLLAFSEFTLPVEELKDHSDKHAWDYAHSREHKWILNLRDERKLLTGATASSTEKLGTLVLPKPKSVIANVCWKTNANLVQLYISDNKQQEFLDLQQRSVYELIYHQEYGPKKFFQWNERLGGNTKATCKWIHLPANNEKWVKDLFLRLRLIDHSIVPARRHQGTAPYDRHMMAGAWKYKQILVPESEGDVANETPAFEDTPANPFESWGALSSSSTTRTARSPRVTRSLPRSYSSSVVSVDGGVKRNATVLFMPIFGFEQHQFRKKLTAAIDPTNEAHGSDHTQMLIRAYFKPSKALHPRRTLDQFTYHMLKDTEKRDNSQVIFRWARKMEKLSAIDNRRPLPNKDSDQDGYPILMIDQLWIWVLEDDDKTEDTVITSFPDTWNAKEGHNLRKQLIDQELRKNKDRPLIHSAMDLANLVIKCSVDFMKREGPLRVSLQESFQSSINDVAEKQATLFEDFKMLVKELNDLSDDRPDQKKRGDLTNKLFQLTRESHLLTIIMDIQDELKTIKDVFSKQKDALAKFLELSKEYDSRKRAASKEPREVSDRDTEDEHAEPAQVHEDQGEQSRSPQPVNSPPHTPLNSPSKSKSPGHSAIKEKGKRGGNRVRWKDEQPRRNAQSLAAENLALVNANIDAVQEMSDYAAKVHKELNDLLDLKQKQANAWEARFAREGSEQTQRQGNITMVFTMVTIFFLPLSFMSSVFALSVDIFPRDPDSHNVSWPAGEVMGLLFGISLAVIIPLAAIAFGVNGISAWFAKKKNEIWPPDDQPRRGDDGDSSLEGSRDSDSFFKGNSRDSSTTRVYIFQARRFLGLSFGNKLVRYVSTASTQTSSSSPHHGFKRHFAWLWIMFGRRPPWERRWTIEDGTTSTSSTRPSGSGNPSSSASSSVPSSGYDLSSGVAEIAPLFGRFSLHRHVPWLRELWRYGYYSGSLFGSASSGSVAASSGSDAESSEDRWSDSVQMDYPLHRFLHGVRNLVRRFLVDPVLHYSGLRWLWNKIFRRRAMSVTTASTSSFPTTVTDLESGLVESEIRRSYLPRSRSSRRVSVRRARSSTSEIWD